MDGVLDAPVEFCRDVNAIRSVHQPEVKCINRNKTAWNYFFIAVIWQEDLIINSVPANGKALNGCVLLAKQQTIKKLQIEQYWNKWNNDRNV